VIAFLFQTKLDNNAIIDRVCLFLYPFVFFVCCIAQKVENEFWGKFLTVISHWTYNRTIRFWAPKFSGNHQQEMAYGESSGIGQTPCCLKII